MIAKRSLPTKGRKAEQIMRAARKLFLQHGFLITSMDAIAAKANVSKATLYSYFASKENLFASIVTNFLDSASPEIIEEGFDKTDILGNLMRMGHGVAAVMLARDDVAAHRMVVAEAVRSPALGKLYFEVGPARLLSHLSHILKQAMNAGQLRPAPSLRAAEQFVSLVMGNLHLEALLTVRKRGSSRTRQSTIKSGVDVFYRAYRPEKTQRRRPNRVRNK